MQYKMEVQGSGGRGSLGAVESACRLSSSTQAKEAGKEVELPTTAPPQIPHPRPCSWNPELPPSSLSRALKTSNSAGLCWFLLSAYVHGAFKWNRVCIIRQPQRISNLTCICSCFPLRCSAEILLHMPGLLLCRTCHRRVCWGLGTPHAGHCSWHF